MSPFRPLLHPRPTGLRRIVGAAVVMLAVTLSACSDGSTAPAAKRSGYLTISAAVKTAKQIDFPAMYPSLASQVPTKTIKGDTTIQSFSVTPSAGKLILFGATTGNVLAIPPNTLCNPSTNTYGPTEWKKACTLATAVINFQVKSWKDAAGHAHAEFSPAMRFNPSSPLPVTLYFPDPSMVQYQTFVIPYCNAQNVCVDEGAVDPYLETYVTPLPLGGYYVYRALRHFSGYNVTAD